MIPVNPNLLPGSPLPGTACRAALVRSTATVRPGGRIRVGVVLELAPHHHVYWTNPGDSGLAPSVAWTLPEGWTAGPIEWPAPRRITADGIVTFGYEGGVLLPVTLTVPDDAPTGDVIVGAYIEWLVCSESACVPGKASAEVRLNVAREPSRDARGPSDDARRADLEDAVTWELLLARTGHLRPAPVPADGARLATAGNSWTLAVDLPTDVGDVRVADFFAEDSLVLDASAVPTIESAENGRVVLRLTPAPRTAARAVRLRGVLVVTAVAQTQAYAIDVPIH